MPNRLEQLPDELVLGIFSHLRPLRKETYEDFEATSVTEAHQALTSLCLTSKRLSTIATPILYSDAIVSQPDELGPAQISQLLRTIIRDPVRGQQIAYIEHISIQCHQHICAYEYDHKQYYESAIWTEHRKHIQSVARRFWNGERLESWGELLRSYPDQAQLVLLLRLCPNITHIYVGMIRRVYGWCLNLLSTYHSDAYPPTGEYGFSRLEKVCIDTMKGWSDRGDRGPSPDSSEDLSGFLQALPSLRQYGQIAFHGHGAERPVLPFAFHLPKLETLTFHDSKEAIGAALSMIEACTNLKRFTFQPLIYWDNIPFKTIYASLLTRKHTLELITLWNGTSRPADIAPSGFSFAQFTHLRSLDVSDVMLMGVPDDYDPDEDDKWHVWNNHKPRHRLSSILPPSLETLRIDNDITSFSGDIEFLWNFVDDLAQLPLLRVFRLTIGSKRRFTKLSAEFSKHGVEFKVELTW
jgi:hypothetical protein